MEQGEWREERGVSVAKFRLQDLKIWREAIEIADKLFDISDELEQKKLYRFAKQLRGAGMSMSNNIAEGSGSNSKAEFKQYLNFARRSTFENANILILLNRRKLLTEADMNCLMDNLEVLSRQITTFQRSLG